MILSLHTVSESAHTHSYPGVSLPELSELDRCIDHLRDRSIGIRELVGKRESLESVFLGAVGAKRSEPASADGDAEAAS